MWTNKQSGSDKTNRRMKAKITLPSLKRLISPGIRHKIVLHVNEQSPRILRGKADETGAHWTIAKLTPWSLDSGIQLSVGWAKGKCTFQNAKILVGERSPLQKTGLIRRIKFPLCVILALLCQRLPSVSGTGRLATFCLIFYLQIYFSWSSPSQQMIISCIYQ